MTMIVNFPTKKALKEAAANNTPIVVKDPALMPEWRKYGETFTAQLLPLGAGVCVTNHPKRSWFAEIRQTTKGLRIL